ncbi:hypothetical protein BX666DRAFT_2030182 [Dichotomocladium elegans]|nr:hypothetical protein BX666DRAFT_2030182 [Dichotomocladium elegans]
MSERSIEQQQQHHPFLPSDEIDDGSQPMAAQRRRQRQELGRELEALLDGFCSDAQRRFILDQQIASPQQLQRVRQTIQQIRNASGDLIEGHNSEAIRQSLTGVSLEMLDYYRTACQRRRLAHFRDGTTHQRLTKDWHKLSELFEDKAKEQALLGQVYDRLGSLQKAWKRPHQQHMEQLLTALLATNFDLPPGAYIVLVDHHNYCQLGLGRKAIGSRQIIFDTSRISRKQQMDVVASVCDRFASVFAQNAQHNLAQIEAQAQRAQLALLSKQLEQLQHEIYRQPEQDLDDSTARLSTVRPIQRSTSTGTSTSSSTSFMPDTRQLPQQQQQQQQPHFLPLQGASSFIYIQNHTIGLQNLPLPSFVPSPWEWADLLKVRRPYSPLLFGLFKHRRRSSSNGAAAAATAVRATGRTDPIRPRRVWHFLSRNMMSQQSPHGSGKEPFPAQVVADAAGAAAAAATTTTTTRTTTEEEEEDEDDVDEKEVVTFASVSFQSLCSHFCRRGRQFYEDLVASAQIQQSQDRRMLQTIGRDLVDAYAAIQLEASRAHMHRILTILHDMALLEIQLFPHSSDAWVASASQSPPPPQLLQQ